MKKLFYLLIGSLLLLNACKVEPDGDLQTYRVDVQLVYPEGSEFGVTEGVKVSLKNTSLGTGYEANTDASGVAVFNVSEGVYVASASDVRPKSDGKALNYNGTKSGITVTAQWNADEAVELALTETERTQIVIKELYNGGCQQTYAEGHYAYDKYAILYNNSDYPASVGDICLAMINPFNSNGTNQDYVDGKLKYTDWLPACWAFWYFQTDVTLDPWSQIVIALHGAIDHTETYPNSVNLANSGYYCTYDLENYSQAAYYPAPYAGIPTSHHLKAKKFGLGNAWSLSVSSPAFFIFAPDITLDELLGDAYTDYYKDSPTAANIRKKVSVDWVVDGIEVFVKGAENNAKRMVDAVDAGYVEFTNYNGYTLYRNVDAAATKAIEGNEAKLVMGYAYGTETTDPSGIDAEASIKNGAIIVYKDTNNSTNDFHQRKQASIKD